MKASRHLWLSLALACCTPLASAQDAAPAPSATEDAASPHSGDVIFVSTEGLRAALTSPKDQALVAALELLIARANELPGELGQPNQVPPAAIPLIERLVYGQMALRVGMSDPATAPDLPFYARLELGAQAGHAPFAELLENLFAQVGMEPAEPDAQGRRALPIPLPAWYRDTDGNFELEIGDVSARTESARPLVLADGARPSMKVSFDYGALMQNLMPMLAANAGADQQEELNKMLELTGMGELRIDTISGHDDARGYTRSAMRNWAKQQAAEVVSLKPIPTAVINRVPANAEWASITSFDFTSALAFYGGMFEDMVDEDGQWPNLFEEVFGIEDFELERDLTRYMGTSQVVYASPAGGGGIYSMVAAMTLVEPDAFATSLARLEELFMSKTSEETRGYMRLAVDQIDGARFTTLQFPGMPIPLSLTYAVADGYWVMGLSRAAVEASLLHAKHGAPGLLDAPGFLEQAGGDPAGATTISYFNTPGLLADGYAIADMAATMLANTMRSRSGTEGEVREVGQILPSLADLQEGALPMVSISWIDGDDLITESRTDRSALVNATAVAPYFAGIYSIGMALGLLAGNVDKNLDFLPQQAAAQRDIREIRAAMDQFAAEHDGQYPKTIRALVRRTEDGTQYLVRDDLPLDPWHRWYHYDPPTRRNPQPRVYSLGADGELGGQGADRDIHKDTVLGQKPNPFEQLIEAFK